MYLQAARSAVEGPGASTKAALASLTVGARALRLAPVILDAGHFALEDHADVIAQHISRFTAALAER
jgi:hypothetical protein